MRKSRADKECVSLLFCPIFRTALPFFVRVITNFINYFITESEAVTGKSQTEALLGQYGRPRFEIFP